MSKGLPFVPLRRAGSGVYVSGQCAIDPADGSVVGTDVATQTKQVLSNIAQLLASEGLCKADIVKVNAYITRRDDFAAFNAAYAGFFGGTFPTRTTVIADLVDARYLVEIDVVAFKA